MTNWDNQKKVFKLIWVLIYNEAFVHVYLMNSESMK